LTPGKVLMNCSSCVSSPLTPSMLRSIAGMVPLTMPLTVFSTFLSPIRRS